MTRSLREALHDASDDSGRSFRLTPDETLDLARRRTRHLRWSRPVLAAAAVAAAAVAALVLGTLTLPQLLRQTPPGDDVPATRPPTSSPSITQSPTMTIRVGPSTYNQEVLTPAQALARCKVALDTPINRLNYAGRAVPQWVKLEETGQGLTPGALVRLRDQKNEISLCAVPQASQSVRVLGSLPGPSDHDAIKRACTSVLGYDLTGWRVVTTAARNGAVVAVLTSTNGWDASCRLTPESWLSKKLKPYGPDQDAMVYRIGAGNLDPGIGTQFDATSGVPGVVAGSYRLGAGTVMQPSGVNQSAVSVTVTLSSGKSFTVPVVEGRYAYVLPSGHNLVISKTVFRDRTGKVVKDYCQPEMCG